MGAFGDGDSKRKSRRGSVNNENRLAGLKEAVQPNSSGADWGRADPRWIAAVVVACTLANCAVTFTTSRDGGAFGLTLFLGGQRETLWFNADADIDLELEKVFAWAETLQ